MSVYVDGPFSVARVRAGFCGWRSKYASHLFADTEEELHALAARIGLKREWFQNEPGKLPHYDIAPALRHEAVEAGAVVLNRRQAAKHIRAAREAVEKGA